MYNFPINDFFKRISLDHFNRHSQFFIIKSNLFGHGEEKKNKKQFEEYKTACCHSKN